MAPRPPMGLSVVVPVKDEAPTVATLVASLRRQSLPPDEVIFVDGGSRDATAATIEALTADEPRFRLIRAGDATPGRGRNVGIEHAAHEWVGLTDAGIELDRHWLDRLVRVVEQEPACDIVYGSFEPAAPTFFQRCAAIAYVQALRPSPLGPVRDPSIASALLRKEAWRRAGGFPDLRAAEDQIFMRRLQRQGSRVACAPEARVTWHLQPTLRATFARFRTYSRHNVVAGEQASWHHGVARLYGVALVPVLLGSVHRRAWLALPVAGGTARIGRTLWRRREGRGIGWVLRPDRFALVGVILAVIDAATFVGWAEGAMQLRRHAAR
ncbi:MAG: glycosyltransferase [Acidimicrobiales bacterium]